MVMGACMCGHTGWSFAGDLGSPTACNCTLCRRYGALWSYGWEGEQIAFIGESQFFRRPGKADPALEVCFCSGCGCVTGYRALRTEPDGRRKAAVNLRMASPMDVVDLRVDHFDGLITFDDLPSDGKLVRDLWS